MKIYHYDIDNIFTESTIAEVDPIEKKPLIPANSTTVKPEIIRKGWCNIFDEKTSTWQESIDCRGTKIYDKETGEEIEIKNIGEYDKSLFTEKEFIRDHIWKDDEWVQDIEKLKLYRISERTAYLESTDWYVIRKLETGKEIPSEVLEYREKLRKVENSDNFPYGELPVLEIVK